MSRGHPDCILEAVVGGASLTARDNEGDTALDLAKAYGYADCIALLKEAARQPDPVAWARARLGR